MIQSLSPGMRGLLRKVIIPGKLIFLMGAQEMTLLTFPNYSVNQEMDQLTGEM